MAQNGFDGKLVKGEPRARGAGRPKGRRNNLTLVCRELLANGFERLGGLDGLVEWASKNDHNREIFYKLWVKLLPVQVKVTEHNMDITFENYEALRNELRRTGVPIPERLAPPPVTIDADSEDVK